MKLIAVLGSWRGSRDTQELPSGGTGGRPPRRLLESRGTAIEDVAIG